MLFYGRILFVDIWVADMFRCILGGRCRVLSGPIPPPISMVSFAGRTRGACNDVQRIIFFYCPAVFRVSRRYNRRPDSHPPIGLAIASSYQEPLFCPQAGRVSFGLDEKEAVHRIRGVISRILNGTVEDVTEGLQNDRDCSEIQPSVSLVDSLFMGFGDDWKSALGFFRWAGLHSGYRHTSGTYDRMLDLLGKMKQLDRMMELVNEMREEGLITLQTVAKVMRRLAAAGRSEHAIKVFDDLATLGLEKNTEAMNILLDTLCKEKCVEAAREVFLQLKTHIPPNAYTFNIFVHGWCKANRIDEAEWTILEMKGYGFQPSVITYSTVIEAYCKHCSFHKVYKLLDEMHAEGCTPNVVTYTIVMHSLAKSEEYEPALHIVDRVKSTGCKPDTLFYNSLIYVLGRAGRLSEASHIFEIDMHLNGVTPNLSTYNTMISMFCHHSHENDALNVLEKMEHASCKPDLLTYSPLLKLCFKRGKIDDMLSILMNDIVNKHYLSLDLSTYTLLIHGLCRSGKLEWALLLFEEMISQEIPPRSRTCNLLLREAEERNMYGIVDRIKDMIKQIRNTKTSD